MVRVGWWVRARWPQLHITFAGRSITVKEWVRDDEVLEIEGSVFKVLYVFVRMVDEHAAPAHPPYYVKITPAQPAV